MNVWCDTPLPHVPSWPDKGNLYFCLPAWMQIHIIWHQYTRILRHKSVHIWRWFVVPLVQEPNSSIVRSRSFVNVRPSTKNSSTGHLWLSGHQVFAANRSYHLCGEVWCHNRNCVLQWYWFYRCQNKQGCRVKGPECLVTGAHPQHTPEQTCITLLSLSRTGGMDRLPLISDGLEVIQRLTATCEVSLQSNSKRTETKERWYLRFMSPG